METPEVGESFTAEIDRISNAKNGIIETEDGLINIGPVTEDSVGKEVEAEMMDGLVAYCKTKSVTRSNYSQAIERLKSDKKNIRPFIENIENSENIKNSAVEISNAAKTDVDGVEKAVPELKRILQNEDSHPSLGAVTSALAEIENSLPGTVDGIEEEILELLESNDKYQQLNAVLAVTALDLKDALERIEKLNEKYHEQKDSKGWAVTELSLRILSSETPSKVQFEHISTILSGGIDDLVYFTGDMTQLSADYVALAVLLDEAIAESKRTKLKDALLDAAQNEPEHLHDSVPILEEKILIGQKEVSEDSAQILQEYAKNCSEKVDQLSETIYTSVSNTDTGSVDTNLDSLREKAEEKSVEKVDPKSTTSVTTTEQYNRSQAVKEYVKARADGMCEGCGESAPFTSKTGEPYLHAHHIHELSDGGSDTPDTVVALCPNCHYRIHHGVDGEEYNQELLKIVQQLEQ